MEKTLIQWKSKGIRTIGKGVLYPKWKSKGKNKTISGVLLSGITQYLIYKYIYSYNKSQGVMVK